MFAGFGDGVTHAKKALSERSISTRSAMSDQRLDDLGMKKPCV